MNTMFFDKGIFHVLQGTLHPLRFSKYENKKEHIPSIQQEWKQKRLYPFALAGMKTNKEFIPSL